MPGLKSEEKPKLFVTFRTDTALRAAIEAAASREGVSVSKWVVARLRDAVSGEVPVRR